jgi:hypothetical protein
MPIRSEKLQKDEPKESDNVFLTGSDNVEEEIEEDSNEPADVAPTPIPPLTCSTSPNRTEQLRSTINYDLIYSTNDWEDPTPVTISGAPSRLSFHPVFPKKVYQIDAAHTMTSQQLKAQYGQSAPIPMNSNMVMITCPDQMNKTNKPSTIPSNKSAKVERNKSTRRTLSPSGSRNLGVIKSNKFLRELLLKSNTGNDHESLKDSQSAVDEMSIDSSLADNGLIYEAYQNQVDAE